MKCENPNSQYIEFKWNLISNCDWNNRQLFLTKKTLKISKKKSSRIPSVSTKRWDPRRSQLFFFSADMSRSRLDSCETKFGNCATSRSAGAMIWMNCQKKSETSNKNSTNRSHRFDPLIPSEIGRCRAAHTRNNKNEKRQNKNENSDTSPCGYRRRIVWGSFLFSRCGCCCFDERTLSSLFDYIMRNLL